MKIKTKEEQQLSYVFSRIASSRLEDWRQLSADTKSGGVTVRKFEHKKTREKMTVQNDAEGRFMLEGNRGGTFRLPPSML